MKSVFAAMVLVYLKILAKLQLKKNDPTIIGITGSAGKTSALKAVHTTLKEKESVKASYKANSESGIPLNILGFTNKNYSFIEWLLFIIAAPLKLITNWEKYDIYIAEMAIDSPHPPKNMEYLLTILKPDVGVFLNAKPMHSEAFDEMISEANPEKRKTAIIKAIAKEKGKLITSLPQDGAAILNADDPEVIAFKDKTPAKVISFGTTDGADIQINEINQSLSGSSFGIQYQNTKFSLNFPDYALPNHFGHTFAAALGVAITQQIPLKIAAAALEKNFRPPKGRATLIEGINQSYIFDSSYNASAEPTIDSLNLLNKISPKGKLALLGDIRELGKESMLEHVLVAEKAAKICDQVYLVGPNMKKYALPVLKEKKVPVKWFPTAKKAALHIKQILKKDDVILIKGSQNTLLLEIAVEALMKNPEKADQLLCRRGSYWNKRRSLLT